MLSPLRRRGRGENADRSLICRQKRTWVLHPSNHPAFHSRFNHSSLRLDAHDTTTHTRRLRGTIQFKRNQGTEVIIEFKLS
jgi:hypothetical protein